ncbi:MAG: hypothetical protein GC160_08930 [Acidobacteria bacterium]|nr:hypothetical protein [Acidobacteriota bacterium]
MSKQWMLGVGVGLDLGGIALIVLGLEEAGWQLALGLAMMLVGTVLVTRAFQGAEAPAEPDAATVSRKLDRWRPEPELRADPPRKVKPTFTAWLTIGAWSAMLAVAGGFAWYNVLELNPPIPSQGLLESEGAHVGAEIHRKEVRDHEGGRRRYYLYYNFQDQTGSSVRSSVVVSKTLFDRYREGASLDVVYLPGDPMVHFVPALTQASFALRALLMGAVVAMFFLFLLIARMLRHRRLARSGRAVAGMVEKVSRRGGSKSLRIRYSNSQGKEQTLTAFERNPARKTGDVVTVMTDRAGEAEMYSLLLFRAVEQ